MKPCRWCGQPIEPSAQRCHHCRTWQRDGADHEDVRKAQILDEGIIKWGKFVAGVATLFVVVAIAAGGYDIYGARTQAWEAQMRAQTSQGEAERASLSTSKLLDEAQRKIDNLLEDARAKLDKVEQRVDEQNAEIERRSAEFRQQIEYITGRAGSLPSEDPAQVGDSLRNQGELISVLQRQVATLQEGLATIGGTDQAFQTKAAPLSAEEWAELDKILLIEQSASKVAGTGTTGTRQSYDVVFRLCSFENDQCSSHRLNEVFRVIYRFDPKWFTAADVPVASDDNQFRYAVRVWGVTRVRACIFIRGAAHRPIVREAAMNLADDEPTYWGPDPSAKPDACSGLSSF